MALSHLKNIQSVPLKKGKSKCKLKLVIKLLIITRMNARLHMLGRCVCIVGQIKLSTCRHKIIVQSTVIFSGLIGSFYPYCKTFTMKI